MLLVIVEFISVRKNYTNNPSNIFDTTLKKINYNLFLRDSYFLLCNNVSYSFRQYDVNQRVRKIKNKINIKCETTLWYEKKILMSIIMYFVSFYI